MKSEVRHIGLAAEGELAAVVELADGALVAVLAVDVVDVVDVVDAGEAPVVIVRVTVAVGAAAGRWVDAAPEPHPETSAAPPSTQMSSRRRDTVA